MRIGLVGTGHWAAQTHVPALAAEPSVDLVGLWGRSTQRTRALGDTHRLSAYDSFEDLLADVDAVAFSVPPEVQAALARRAAEAHKHLLLEKPLALELASATALVSAVEEAGVSTVVNFSWRFDADHRVWLDQLRSTVLVGGWSRLLTSALVPGSPYEHSGWRQEHGALWDLMPHVLGLTIPALGRVEAVTAVGGLRDLVHLTVRHEQGRTSTTTLTLNATPAAASSDLAFWGPDGVSTMPRSDSTAQQALGLAARELATLAGAEPGTRHPCDVHLGLEVVQVLLAAQRSLRSGRTQRVE